MTVVLIGTALLLSVYMVVNILYKRTNHYRIPTVIWRITVKEFPVAYV